MRGALVFFCGLAVCAGFAPAFGRVTGRQEIPGPLSAAHIPKPGETDCSACHRTMDSKHRDVTGYAYSSQASYACHPRGTR